MEIKIAAFIIFPLIFIAKFLINYENNKVVRCTANAIINRAGLLAKVKIELSMSDENGVFFIDGDIYRDDIYYGAISRRVFFDVKTINNDILLISNRNWSTEIDGVDITFLSGTLFSEFYFSQNSSIVLSLTRNKNGDYYFSTKTMPITYCAKIAR